MKMLPTIARRYGRRPTARARVDERVHAGVILPHIHELLVDGHINPTAPPLVRSGKLSGFEPG